MIPSRNHDKPNISRSSFPGPADILTGLRILCCIPLLLPSAYSTAFLILYLAAGISDMLDGTIARRTGTACEAGARLDTVADLVFAAVCLIKLIPVLHFPLWIILWAAGIGCLKLTGMVAGCIAVKRFVPIHSVLNKATGILLFLLPLAMRMTGSDICPIIVCAIATAAAIDECLAIRSIIKQTGK